MIPPVMFNSVSFAHDVNILSEPNHFQEFGGFNPVTRRSSVSSDLPPKKSKKRNLPGNLVSDPDPDAEVVALSPASLMATYKYVCEICNKGFYREQNLQLHRRGHNLPWKLEQRTSGKEMKKKRVYICPEPTCIYHHRSRALGDLTAIKKHFCRKHYDGEKKWKCEKCAKPYAVESDWKAHSKKCGRKENPCDRGTISSRNENLATQRVQWNSLADENANLFAPINPNANTTQPNLHFSPLPPPPPPPPPSFFNLPSSNYLFPDTWELLPQNPNPETEIHMTNYHEPHINTPMMISPFTNSQSAPTTTIPSFSATTLLQKAATVGNVGQSSSTMSYLDMHDTSKWQKSADRLTHDFLGLTDRCTGRNVDRGEGSGSAEVLPYFGEVDYQQCNGGNSYFKHQEFDDQSSPSTWVNYW